MGYQFTGIHKLKQYLMIFILLYSSLSLAQKKVDPNDDPNESIGRETAPSVLRTAILPLEAIDPALSFSIRSLDDPLLFDSPGSPSEENSTKAAEKESSSN